jgi:hypothetical protein
LRKNWHLHVLVRFLDESSSNLYASLAIPDHQGGIMQLLTAELRSQLPPLYSQEKNKDPTVHLKIFCPWSNWTWFATEGSEDDGEFLFFGYVIGHEEEWGYFALSEMEAIRGPGGLALERDLYFKAGPFSQVIEQHRRAYGR